MVPTPMAPVFRIEPVEDVPASADVGHYDELRPPAKARLAAVVDDGATRTADPAFRRTAAAWDVVKFTDYYRIEWCGPEG